MYLFQINSKFATILESIGEVGAKSHPQLSTRTHFDKINIKKVSSNIKVSSVSFILGSVSLNLLILHLGKTIQDRAR